MRLLVTGATGFIGRSLISHLATQPDISLVLLLRENYSGHPLPLSLAADKTGFVRSQFDVVYADLRNFQLVVRAVREAEPEVVVHLAAAGVTDPFLPVETALRHNLTGTINLLRACFEKTFTTRQLIIGRTPGERSSMNVYAASKAAAWNFCQMYSRTQQWPIHGAMIFQAYGPGQHEQSLLPSALQAALAGEDFPMTSGVQERDWIYVEDVASGLSAMMGAALTPGMTVELGTGRPTSVADVVHQVYALANRGGRPLVGVLPGRPGEEVRQVADAARTRSLIGWEATTSLREGLSRLIEGKRSSN